MKSTGALSDTVYNGLKADLASSVHRAGAVLSEERLARRFRVSRTPVRKALVRLEQEGLVRILPKRGVVVPEVSPGELRELFDVREALEGMAARQAAGRVDPRARSPRSVVRKRGSGQLDHDLGRVPGRCRRVARAGRRGDKRCGAENEEGEEKASHAY